MSPSWQYWMFYIIPRGCHHRGGHLGRISIAVAQSSALPFNASIQGCHMSSPSRKCSRWYKERTEGQNLLFLPLLLNYDSSPFQIIHPLPNSSVQEYTELLTTSSHSCWPSLWGWYWFHIENMYMLIIIIQGFCVCFFPFTSNWDSHRTQACWLSYLTFFFSRRSKS